MLWRSMTASTHVTWTGDEAAGRGLTCCSHRSHLQEAMPYRRMNGLVATCVRHLRECLCAVESGCNRASKPVLDSLKNSRCRPVSQKRLLPTPEHKRGEPWGEKKRKKATAHLLQGWQRPLGAQCTEAHFRTAFPKSSSTCSSAHLSGGRSHFCDTSS